MGYREWAPPTAWRAVVACCWEQHVSVERVQRVLPDGCADILVFGTGAIEVVGVADEAARPVLPAGTSIRGIRIRPEAVAATFALDAASLRNRKVALGDVLGARRARSLTDHRALDAWIGSIRPDPRAAAAVQMLRAHRITTAAELIGLSERQLRRTMLTHVGLGPKRYQQVVRLRRFLARAGAGDPLAVAAAGAGYADQAHMTREVRRLSGTTPTALLAERGVGLNDAP